LRRIDARILEQHVAEFVARLPSEQPHSGALISPQGEVLHAQALDGKTLRTASAHGKRIHLVSLVEHTTGRTWAQRACAEKQAELKASQHLLRERDLSGTVTTMDAGLTSRLLSQQIR
jgi:hypothetical protein